MTQSTAAYVIRRLLLSIPVLWGVTLISFLFVVLAPQSPAITGLQGVSPEQVAQMKADLGLNRPIYIQYLDWFGADWFVQDPESTGGLITGNLGDSLVTDLSVINRIAEPFFITAELAIWGSIWMLIFSTVLGMVGAFYRNRFPDHFARFYAVLGISVPDFVIGILLLLVFSVSLNVFPVGGWEPWSAGVITHMSHVILPSYTIGFLITGLITRLFRGDLLEMMDKEHVRAAKAVGLSKKRIVVQDIVKPAIIPTITSIGTTIAAIMGGVVLTEEVFAIPGMGRLAVQAAFNGDYAVLQGIILIVATLFVLVNLVVDVSYYYLDPRMRYSE